ncbi:CvpA family protein [Acholeplasma hippikon]|uniref:Uncharacterized protein n=1 Tax=Acholeplasma hippikon TaxID=264636 RepID=A0A449BI89_9MOLU|nr:CvpA family protein [Acholeplasma hippikon]VEU82152.1 Uncharacterised protein [Acholeplasma hippikon]
MQIDYANYPDLFLYAQLGAVGLAALSGFLFGLKRGFYKALWNLVSSVVVYGGFIALLSLVHLTDVVKPEMLNQIVQMINIPEVTKYYNYVIEANALNAVLSIVDLVIKIILFVVLSGFLRWLINALTFGIVWLFIRKKVKRLPKHRFLGGMVGMVKGAAFSVILFIPALVLFDTIVGDGLESSEPELQEITEGLSKANEVNMIRYINEIEINGVGAGNYLFDLVFTSKVDETQTITWREELVWVAEGVRTALPQLSELENGGFENFTIDDIIRYEGFFVKFSESKFLNSLVKPGIKVGLTFLADDESNTFISKDDLEALYARVDATEIVLSEDIYDIYLAVKDLLTIQDYQAWQALFNDYSRVALFDETQQALFVSALNKVANLDLIELGDIALEVAIFMDEVKHNITWIQTDEQKVQFLNNVKTKITAYEGNFIRSVLNQTVDLFETVLYEFPGIDLDNDGIADVELKDFLSRISDLTVILNSDDTYHAWFKDALTKFGDYQIIDTFMEEITDYMFFSISNAATGWAEEELDLLLEIINENFGSTDDLKRELAWIADVYKELGKLNIAVDLANNEDFVVILDNLLTTNDGREQFKITFNKILDGQTISQLTNRMSRALVDKFLTEPLELVEPITAAMDIPTFQFRTEMDAVVDIVLGLYEEGLTLADAFSDNANMIATLLPALIEFVKDEDNKNSVLSSNILYSFINYNLTKLDAITVPDTAFETTGVYATWIKKSELSVVLDVLGGLADEMEAQGLNIADLFSGENADLLTDLLPVIKNYASDDDNRTLLLSSEILYYTLSENLKEVDALEVPEDALDTLAPYENWILRTELDKLLRAIIIIDIDIPAEGESLDLSGITGEKLRDVIAVESAIIRRNITTQLLAANLLTIPTPAFMNPIDLKDLKQEELLSLADLLVTLNLDLGALGEDSDPTSILNTVLVDNLISIDYEDSFLIRSFITMGIESGLTLHPLAMDPVHNEILSATEIGELFKILDTLDPDDNMTVQELLDTMSDPNNLTFKQVSDIVNAGDSIIIRSLLSENLLAISLISDLNLKEEVYHNDGTAYVHDLLSYDEVKRLVASLIHVADSEDDFVMDLASGLDVNAITLDKINLMIGESSLIVNTLVSTKIDELGVIDIHPDAQDQDGEIMNVHLQGMMQALANTLGGTTTINDLDTIQDELSIGNLRTLITSDSLIINYFMTKMILDNVGQQYDRTLAHDSDPLVFSSTEFTNLFNGLAVLDPAGDETTQVVEVVGSLNDLTITEVSQVVASGSHILRARISHELITNLGEDDIHPHTIDGNGDILQADLDDLFLALAILGPNTKVTELGTLVSDNMTLQTISDMRQSNSRIFEGMLSKIIVRTMSAQDVEIRDDVYVNDIELGKDGFGLLTATEVTSLLNSIGILSGNPNSPLLSVVQGVNINTISPLMLGDIADEESVIIYRLITKNIIDSGISVPTDSLQAGYLNEYLTKLELTNIGLALDAFGLTSLEVNSINSQTTSFTILRNVVAKDSMIVNRKVSEGIVSANLDTVESHETMEDNDIQTEEILNLFDAFEALSLSNIADKDSISVFQLFAAAQSIPQADFETYIGYGELDEEKGMTIVKDFLIERLDDQIPDFSNPGQNIRVQTRQDLIDLIYG